MTVIGMIFMLGGVFVFFSSGMIKTKKGNILGAGVLMGLGGMCIGIGGNPAKDMPNGSPGMVVLGFVMVGIAIYLLAMIAPAEKAAFRKEQEKIANQKLIDFYNECVKNGIKDCKTEKEIQKATLIAKKRNLHFTDINELYHESKAALSRTKQNEKAEAFDAKKTEEKRMCNVLNMFSDYTGRDKRIAMLSAERAEELSTANTLRNGANSLLHASQQKEIDWATHGGIASGIAGPAAGLAVAADIQSKNAQIRTQNEANLKAFTPVLMTSYGGASNHEKKAKALLEEIEETKTKLVSNDDAKTCLSHLTFSNTKVEVSETGTCTVTTIAKQSTPMVIFGDVNAIIDGTVTANIYDGESLVGSANLVFPKYGVKNNTELKGMCLYCGKQDKNYTVDFSATNLWAMEK